MVLLYFIKKVDPIRLFRATIDNPRGHLGSVGILLSQSFCPSPHSTSNVNLTNPFVTTQAACFELKIGITFM
jgi:hypothetical protein